MTSIKTTLLLLLWLLIGTILRLTNLAAKPPWTDEFCTLVFSLGNSFASVPLDRAIAIDVLLQPLYPNPNAGLTDVIKNLLSESNHPPLYFLLAHWWMQHFSTDAVGLASIWAGRSLSAILGAASILCIYGLSELAFGSRKLSHLAAAMMAISPYGIFLAQEARHYTLAILWVIASLSCLVIAIQRLPVEEAGEEKSIDNLTLKKQQGSRSLPVWLTASWIAINFLGISTHYFFSLTLCAEAFVLIALWFKTKQPKVKIFNFLSSPASPAQFSPWWQILSVAVGTLIGGLFWLPIFLASNDGGELTAWIQSGDKSLIAWLNPIFQAIAAWITMICLLPVEADALPIVIASGGLMAIFLIWALPIFKRGIITQLQQPATRLMTQVFAGFILGAIALFFFFTYAFGIDLTRGARYNFVYFPAVIVFVAASLAVYWRTPNSNSVKQRFFLSEETSVLLVLLIGFLSAITVVCNLGYQKYYRPDLLVQLVQNVSQSPILIATEQKTHVEIGEMMGIAREFKLTGFTTPQFFLAHQDQSNSANALQQTLNQIPKPVDLWLVNFYAPAKFNNCVAASLSASPVDGYNYQLFHCNQK